ncbi:FAD binding domain-containing protein [Nocardia terpenica]|uniref:Molybdopterin dehydrogenase n=1 Tax=Nocardia terpenica TaxID=455432 RepID=A0A6G9Z939_9NOCA|nr:FAD binding domain-containing protein [Nocardia terpenica]QIS22002.1 molybdopterin dehydrogenase [Nocardia terpenica]
MIRTALRYHRPDAVSAAADLLAERLGEAVVLGGGTMLLPMMHRAEVAARDVIDLRGLGLATVSDRGGWLEIGAMVTYNDVLESAVVAHHAPLLRLAASGITGGEQIRNLGTLGGSACFANPASDMPAVLVALGATMRVYGAVGYREIAAADFFRDAFTSALALGELLVAILVPHSADRYGYRKLELSAGSWPIVTAAAVGDPAGGRLAVTVGAAQAVPVRIDLSGVLDRDGRVDVGEIDAFVRDRIDDPWTDVLADGAYRRDVAGAVARRAVTDLIEGTTA